MVEKRIARLKNEAQILREYGLQIRELFQAEIDIRQNRIMKILTIVTTIFLPLTLVAGWYGMNFSNMPELSWKYGYPAVIVISLVIVMICLWIMKKKKILVTSILCVTFSRKDAESSKPFQAYCFSACQRTSPAAGFFWYNREKGD